MEPSVQERFGRCHGVVIPLYGPCPSDLGEQVQSYVQAGLTVILVQNNPDPNVELPVVLQNLVQAEAFVSCIHNQNRGGVAGGFNRGIEVAIADGVTWITLLDQDSRLPAADLMRLREPWLNRSGERLLVGPRIWDGRRHQVHGRQHLKWMDGYLQTRLLISSGTTLRAADWPLLGPMMEWLVVDFVDHVWSFQSQARGFTLLQHSEVTLLQAFGQRHPNPLCRRLGMELYSPMRHYYSLRNLRWLLIQPWIPLDLRVKEVAKMLFKPWLWLLLEPRRGENLSAIIDALRTPLHIQP